MNGALACLPPGWQPGLWGVSVGPGGGAGGKPVGIGGEVGGDPLLALVATGAGITSLSMATGKVGVVKAALAKHDLATCKAMLAAVLDAVSPQEAKAAVMALVDPEVAEILGAA